MQTPSQQKHVAVPAGPRLHTPNLSCITKFCHEADQDFTELVQKVPDGCLFTIVSDSCHSGGLLDKAKEQIGHSTKQNKAQQGKREERSDSGSGGFRSFLKQTVRDAFESQGVHLPRRGGQQSSYDDDDAEAEAPSLDSGTDGHVKNRSLPLSTFIEMLKEKTGKEDIEVGSIRMTLFNVFGEDASPKIKKFMKVMLEKLQQGQHGGVVGLVGALAQELLRAKLQGKQEELKPAMEQEVHGVEEVYAGTAARAPHNGVLISGCQTDQTSADATTAKGLSYGALSNAIQAILAEKDGKVSNKELVLRARGLLSKQGYKQQPGLYCSDRHTETRTPCVAKIGLFDVSSQNNNHMLSDQDFTELVRKVPDGCLFTMEQTGKDDVGVGSIRTTLFHHFGDDATPKIKKFVKAVVGGNGKLRHGADQAATVTELIPKAKPEGGGQAGALGPAMEQEVWSVEEVYAGATAKVPPPRNGVLISGCQTDESSADLTTASGVSYGALSNAIQAVLAEEKRGKKVTNRELVQRARGLLAKQGYVQQPGLYCSDEHADAAFIC
ncbi:unnamed protein product [Triticum turgidum subsp. durum]|uniref:Peptidase C14 caspase domain-containing protein n=1 Tax=Triticum turgidum subsp. durum TaxID=4567 RepID=A0A9R0QE75_TRITD|nr:unnamed protein product [Triticum turgidum subsp. durum]